MERGISLSVRVASGVLSHNNREFIPKNINAEKINDNIIYKQENLREVYDKLFSEAVRNYNAQKTKTRDKINDYYDKIQSSKQAKLFYEAIIQYGDKFSNPVGSKDGENAKKMLDKYMRDFEKRNPNLYVFNAVLHLDEATPHLHIDFVPITKRLDGNRPETWVSLKSALSQQGISGKNARYTDRQQWGVSEKIIMAGIAKEYNYEVINKGIHRAHMSVEEYKNVMRDIEKIEQRLWEIERDTNNNYSHKDVAIMKNQLTTLTEKLQRAERKINAPIIEIEISSEEKINAVYKTLFENKVAFGETASGITVPAYAEKLVNETLKNFKPQREYSTLRDKLSLDIDEQILHSKDINSLLDNLKNLGYEVKDSVKYIAVKPKGAERFIRLKSLGEEYAENNLKKRIENRGAFHKDFNSKFENAPEYQKGFYAVSIKTANLVISKTIPPRKYNRKKPYTFYNDYRITKLVDCINFIDKNNITKDNITEKISAITIRNEELFKLIHTAKINKEARDNIIKLAENFFSGNDKSENTKSILQAHGVNAVENLEALRAAKIVRENELSELQGELKENKSALSNLRKIDEISNDINEKNYIDKLVEQEKERQKELENEEIE